MERRAAAVARRQSLRRMSAMKSHLVDDVARLAPAPTPRSHWLDGVLEAIAAPLALVSLGPALRGSTVLLFIYNSAALGVLRKGSSSRSDLHAPHAQDLPGGWCTARRVLARVCA